MIRTIARRGLSLGIGVILAAIAYAATAPWPGTLEHVSMNRSGVGGNESSREPAISADGRFVVFISSASNLTAVTSTGAIPLAPRLF
jgi:hypothetical protein